MFCQGMTRCYAHEQAPGMALRYQSLGYLCSFLICPFAMPGMTLVIFGIHNIDLQETELREYFEKRLSAIGS